MGLFDFLKSKKKKEEAPAEAEVLPLDSSELAGIEPPETRYTQEYQDFLASREAAGDGGELPGTRVRDTEQEVMEMKTLVAYFSAGGVTAAVAKRLADALGAALYEIKPETAYTTEDLDWRNQESRSSVEMKDKDCRPPLMDTDAPVAEADLIFLGYPVWWYREPSIIDSFLDAYDFKGKKIVLFATSGTSGIGEEAPQRIARLSGAEVLPGRRFPADVSAEELKAWAETC